MNFLQNDIDKSLIKYLDNKIVKNNLERILLNNLLECLTNPFTNPLAISLTEMNTFRWSDKDNVSESF